MKHNFVALIGIFIILIALIAGGYYTFLFFVKSVVPSFSSYSLVLVAIIAGVSMFFNPCSFSLLPTFLTFFATKKELKDKNKLGKFLLYGLFASLGIVTFSIILGSLIGLLGAGFGKSLSISAETIFRGVIGGLLVFLGIMHFRGVGLHIEFLEKFSNGIMSPKDKGPLMGMYMYGFGYNALGIGCGGPIMAGLFVFSISLGGFTSALLAFIIFSLTMVVLMLLISILVGLSKDTLINKMKAKSGSIKKFTGVILFLVGSFLLLSAVFTRTFVSILFPA